MTHHRIDTTPDTAVDVLTAERRPVLTVAPGDTVTVHTLSAAGYTERLPAPGVEVPTLIPSRRGHCLLGPIAVAGARPGQVLAIRFDDLVPDDWGVHRLGRRRHPAQPRPRPGRPVDPRPAPVGRRPDRWHRAQPTRARGADGPVPRPRRAPTGGHRRALHDPAAPPSVAGTSTVASSSPAPPCTCR
ncbi:acetamidase/formamidase family protein [Curtobacterium sp. MCPF17_052]|uniref:acetamidase/formamidase family protein n=1 Tax=Curtobacterium sp. MCPF17_052 TaxID=2175655 RepID=UPI0024DF8E73|nr:acetamidase/formamidase family protein [Curtobacterium sp. MCPF17_052]WIB11907.1 acetamidase/formamidase family protein [Curtobacterium sp. MCPF17_052]